MSSARPGRIEAVSPSPLAPALAKRIEHWPIERIVPYARNARTHSDEQVAQIAASIREFGFLNPILVDSQAGIIAGCSQTRLRCYFHPASLY